VLQEGTPILCRSCGCPMQLLDQVRLHCGACGASDLLPPDEAGRVLEIKGRLAWARERALQLRGMDASLAHIFEDRGAYLRVMGLYLVVGLGGLLVTLAIMALSLPSAWLAQQQPLQMLAILANSISAPLGWLGVSLSFGVALGVGRYQFRTKLRSLLMARPQPGYARQFGCRVCGGTLAVGNEVEVRCSYCDSLNLVPRGFDAQTLESTQQHLAQQQRQLGKFQVASLSLSHRMRSILIVGVVLSGLVAYGLPYLAQSFLQGLGP
jgi:hypothetical protein